MIFINLGSIEFCSIIRTFSVLLIKALTCLSHRPVVTYLYLLHHFKSHPNILISFDHLIALSSNSHFTTFDSIHKDIVSTLPKQLFYLNKKYYMNKFGQANSFSLIKKTNINNFFIGPLSVIAKETM